MKIKNIIAVILLLLFIGSINPSWGSETQTVKEKSDTTTQSVPIAVVSETKFQAAPVLEGNDIMHDFVIKNTGTGELKISRVKTG